MIRPHNTWGVELIADTHLHRRGRPPQPEGARYSEMVCCALWDGSPAKPNGCGVAETVDFMLGGNDNSEAANGGGVIHILNARQSDTTALPILSRLIEKQTGSLHDALRRTDAFNKNADDVR